MVRISRRPVHQYLTSAAASTAWNFEGHQAWRHCTGINHTVDKKSTQKVLTPDLPSDALSAKACLGFRPGVQEAAECDVRLRFALQAPPLPPTRVVQVRLPYT